MLKVDKKRLIHAVFAVIVVGVLGFAASSSFRSGPFTSLFQKKSSEAAVDRSPMELENNPFGDRWELKKEPSVLPDAQRIQVGLGAGCYRKGDSLKDLSIRAGITDPPIDEVDFWRKSNTGFILEECNLFRGGVPKEYFKKVSSAIAPTKYIGYHALVKTDNNTEWTPEYYSGGATGTPLNGHDDFFLYNTDGSLARTPDQQPLLNLTNTNLRAFLIEKMVAYMNETGIGGVYIDSGYSGYGTHFDGSEHALTNLSLLKGKQATSTGFQLIDLPNWDQYYTDFLRDLNAAMDVGGQDRLLFVNVDGTESAFLQGLIPVIDGILLEDPMGDTDVDFGLRMNNIGAVLDTAKAWNKYIIPVVNTIITCKVAYPACVGDMANPNGSLYTLKDEFPQYYTAGYLNMYRSNKTVLMYYAPTEVGPAFSSESFHRIWDLKLGEAAANDVSTKVFTDDRGFSVYRRKFENGWVYLNNSYKPYRPNSTDTDRITNLFDTNGIEIGRVDISPKTGRIYVYKHILDEWNLANPTSTPTPVVKPGDINRDENVNILDYVILFENFQKKPLPDARADLDGDRESTLLDYVILFENYGN